MVTEQGRNLATTISLNINKGVIALMPTISTLCMDYILTNTIIPHSPDIDLYNCRMLCHSHNIYI